MALTKYKIKQLVRIVDERNNFGIREFYGININKEFMPTVANTEGLDETKYKVVRKNRFVYSGMQTGRDECIRLSMYNKDNPIIVLPAYITFEIIATGIVIPYLLHYCPLACISDGVKTRLGTVRTPYEHFYAWRRVNDEDKVSTLPFQETECMIKGVYSPERFLEIFRDYIYFQDSIYDNEEREIVCRYPQFFATKLLKQSIIKSVLEKSGKGGTYFGATGCGKTYTMAFLARQLSLRCTDIPQIGSPTIIMIVDREDLQKQGAKLFTKSKEFLNLGEVSVVNTTLQLF